MSVRVGFGYDVHRLQKGRRLILGGLHIPSEVGLLGHSDADVLLHAITDAVLGALALGDIGALYPDTDAAWKDADSGELLKGALAKVHELGWQVGNIDATVVLERPKLRPHIDAMRERIAGLLGVSSDAVSVKATTSEQMGFVGTREGAAAYAVCTVVRN
ncbi:MAG: 2-C-methyl-D-erythritol 2,4-cyclodiphosphate synthase [Rhodothermales bacterium]|nr:2-C-methyl-D-erythritol 2,4-cyclodiphosphate synthase [Rhodothermales bacterium]